MAIGTRTRSLSVFNKISLKKLALLILILSLLAPSTTQQQQRRRRTTTATPNCSSMESRSQCSNNPHCRWCASEVINDMCFSKSEAFRLPHQVFLCN